MEFSHGIIRGKILEVVENYNGIKSTELVVRVVDILPVEYLKDIQSIPKIMGKLIEEGEILEIEYILPSLLYKVKSFLLPKGTQIMVKG